MSDIINILPDSVANQIAAGEVVDRPASAVKELLENAMDAGASEIQLIVKDAGRTLIQVIDNGCGMSDSDARLCFERHATSKIHQANDLFAIRTMGFRGEALASIAAVAQVELKTRQTGNELGSCVIIEGSDVKSQEPCNCPDGTSISVKNLFFNIPARRNFLKRDSIELSHIEEVFKRIALPNYQVAFSFYHNGRLLYDLKAGNFAQRIAGFFGLGFKERLYHVEEHSEPVNIRGYIGKAEYAKHSRGEQYIFVNNRFIKHPALSAAIEKSYSDLIPEGTYPSYFFLLDVDPQRIDVNIHPTKTEIRFIDENVIFAILRAATKKALGQFSLANEIEFNPSTEIDFTPARKGYIPPEPKITYNPNYNPFHSSHQDKETIHNDYSNFFDIDKSNNLELPIQQQENNTNGTPVSFATTTPVGYMNRYIITTMKSGIVIIDRLRAQERIFFERLLAHKDSDNSTAQQLLFPVNCSFNASDSELLSELLPELKNAGFVLDQLGQNTFVVTAAPANIKDTDIQDVLGQILSEYKSNMLQKFSTRGTCVTASLSRQIASRCNKTLSPEEMQSVIAELFSCQVPDISPSGKKIMYILNENDLTEKFK